MSILPSLRNKLEELGFKFTDKIEDGSGFIMPDGKYFYLNNQTAKDWISDKDHRYHFCIDDYIREHKLIQTDKINMQRRDLRERYLAYTDDVITIQDGTNWSWECAYLEIPYDLKVTNEQYESLTLWLDNLRYKGTPHVDVNIKGVISRYTFSEDVITDTIIKEIKSNISAKLND